MGFYVRIFRIGPFGYTWHPRRRRRGRWFYGFMPDGKKCPHRHRTLEAARECSRRAYRAA